MWSKQIFADTQEQDLGGLLRKPLHPPLWYPAQLPGPNASQGSSTGPSPVDLSAQAPAAFGGNTVTGLHLTPSEDEVERQKLERRREKNRERARRWRARQKAAKFLDKRVEALKIGAPEATSTSTSTSIAAVNAVPEIAKEKPRGLFVARPIGETNGKTDGDGGADAGAGAVGQEEAERLERTREKNRERARRYRARQKEKRLIEAGMSATPPAGDLTRTAQGLSCAETLLESMQDGGLSLDDGRLKCDLRLRKLEEQRAKNRERVRRWRARQKAKKMFVSLSSPGFESQPGDPTTPPPDCPPFSTELLVPAGVVLPSFPSVEIASVQSNLPHITNPFVPPINPGLTLETPTGPDAVEQFMKFKELLKPVGDLDSTMVVDLSTPPFPAFPPFPAAPEASTLLFPGGVDPALTDEQGLSPSGDEVQIEKTGLGMHVPMSERRKQARQKLVEDGAGSCKEAAGVREGTSLTDKGDGVASESEDKMQEQRQRLRAKQLMEELALYSFDGEGVDTANLPANLRNLFAQTSSDKHSTPSAFVLNMSPSLQDPTSALPNKSPSENNGNCVIESSPQKANFEIADSVEPMGGIESGAAGNGHCSTGGEGPNHVQSTGELGLHDGNTPLRSLGSLFSPVSAALPGLAQSFGILQAPVVAAVPVPSTSTCPSVSRDQQLIQDFN